jgi:phosphoglycolate phosphatase
MSRTALRVVLFDLDGTLIDSAPDLAGAANDMRVARGLPALPYAQLRPMVGSGARGMVGRAFDVGPEDDGFSDLRDEFLLRYEARMTQETKVFPDVLLLLDELDRREVPWGIVTNKATRYSAPIVAALGLAQRAQVLVCGDTTPHAKPHPAPLLEAALRMGVTPAACAYVGDDQRDVQAGEAAGMVTVAVAWGYLGLGDPIEAWGASHVIQSAHVLLKRLDLA